FSYLQAIGPITTARGFKFGGAIINGRSVEGTTLGGGMCSSSTTLFNAVARSGFQIGARRNHYYYIARYPLGLDATVFIDGGYAQDMTWRNDTQYPVLIRAIARPGMIRFTLYNVPTGRTVSLPEPAVTPTAIMPAATADTMSHVESPTYQQRAGSTSNSLAASSRRSGSGFACSTWLPSMMAGSRDSSSAFTDRATCSRLLEVAMP